MGQARSYVKCSFNGDKLKITSASANGRAYDEVAIEKNGDDLEIGFNCKFLLDALRACGTEEVMLALNTALSCMVIRPAEEQEPTTDVLNGIAYDEAAGRIFITGKKWPKIYQIELIKQ